MIEYSTSRARRSLFDVDLSRACRRSRSRARTSDGDARARICVTKKNPNRPRRARRRRLPTSPVVVDREDARETTRRFAVFVHAPEVSGGGSCESRLERSASTASRPTDRSTTYRPTDHGTVHFDRVTARECARTTARCARERVDA